MLTYNPVQPVAASCCMIKLMVVTMCETAADYLTVNLVG